MAPCRWIRGKLCEVFLGCSFRPASTMEGLGFAGWKGRGVYGTVAARMAQWAADYRPMDREHRMASASVEWYVNKEVR